MPLARASASSVVRRSFPLHAHNAAPRCKPEQSSVANAGKLPLDFVAHTFAHSVRAGTLTDSLLALNP